LRGTLLKRGGNGGGGKDQCPGLLERGAKEKGKLKKEVGGENLGVKTIRKIQERMVTVSR